MYHIGSEPIKAPQTVVLLVLIMRPGRAIARTKSLSTPHFFDKIYRLEGQSVDTKTIRTCTIHTKTIIPRVLAIP